MISKQTITEAYYMSKVILLHGLTSKLLLVLWDAQNWSDQKEPWSFTSICFAHLFDHASFGNLKRERNSEGFPCY